MRKIKTLLAKIILISFFITTIFSQYVSAKQDNNPNISNDLKAKEIIVKYKDQNKSETIKSSLKKDAKLTQLKSKNKFKKTKVEVLEVGKKDDIRKVLNELNNDPDVQYAQPNYKLTTNTYPTDANFNGQWGLYNNGQTIGGQAGTAGIDINALPAWTLTKGSQTVVIGVMDTGIDINHPDLNYNIYTNPNEIAGNGTDDDGNGFIDDVNGWDFLNDDKTVYDSNTADVHGTHVAGIVAASANSQGVIGVAPNVKILPLKFINNENGYTSDALEAIEYANLMGVKIVNCSWGGNDYNGALLDAMQSTDILFVCSAGNNGSNTTVVPNYPANFNIPNVLSVAALDNKGNLASFSNYGGNIQVAAPGVNILSTLPENNYGYMSGTSMATPYVTGIAALIKSYKNDMIFTDTAVRIKSNVVSLQSLVGKISSGGRVDAYAALNNNALNFTTEAEPNNLRESATSVAAGKINGNISTIDDVDWFEIDLQNSKPVSIKLKGIPNGNDFDLELYDTNMSKVGFSYNTKNSEETIGITPEIQGAYYIRVKPNVYAGTGEQQYTLDIDLYDGVPAGNEPNNTSASPTFIIENKAYYSTIDNPSDIDWYALDVTKAGKLITTLGQVPEGSDYNIEIYNTNGEKICASNCGGNKDEKINIIANNPGRYLIKVYSNYQEDLNESYGIDLKGQNLGYSINKIANIGASSVQPYEIKTMIVAPDSYEDNDSYKTAKQLNLTDTINATIDNQKDEDWYKVNVTQLTNVYLKLKNIPTGSDYDLTLFNSNMDYVTGSYKRGSISEDAYTEVEPGIYYIKVSSYGGYSDKDAYKLILSPYKLDEYEFNDTFTTSKELVLNQSISATIHNANDQDWYKINFDQAGKLDIQLSNIPANCNYELELYNSNNEKIDESKQDVNKDEVIWKDISTGNYYIKIYSLGGSECDNNYTLTVNKNIGLANAAMIAENSTSRGKIIENFGSNWYKTTVTQPGVLSLNLDNIPENCNYRLTLFDAEGHKLTKSDSISITQESIDFIVTEPGIYYIKAYSIFGYNDTEEYILTTKLTAVADLDVPEKIADGVALGASGTSGTAGSNTILSDEGVVKSNTKLPEEVINNTEFSLQNEQTKVTQGFKTKINKSKIPTLKTTVKTAGFTGSYSSINEQTNMTINVNGVDEAAQVLNYNTIVNGALQSSDTNDYYLFSNNQRGKAIVEIDNAPVGANLQVFFTGVNWGGQYHLSQGVNHDAYVSPIITDATSQYYVIRVIGSGFTSSNVSYRLKITFMPEDFVSAQDPGEMNNNDNLLNGRIVSKSYGTDSISYTSQEATIDFRNDYDAYKLSLDSGYKFTAALRSPGGQGTYYYVLLNSTYTQVGNGVFTAADQAGTQVYELLYNVPTTGTYYLVVFSNGSSYYNTFSKYRVDFYSTRNNESMEFNSSAGTYNDAWEYATAISLNTMYSCKLDTPYDCDTYNISIPAEGKVTINLDKKGYNDNYSLLIKDLDGQIYEYLNSKSDYVFYAQRAGTYKVAVARRNLQSPSSMNYSISTAFTPEASYDAYEYNKNPNYSYSHKNVEFLYSNNQYLKINGMGTTLTDLSSQGTKSISMDNRYDVDWFVIDTAKLSSTQNNGKISLTGMISGDDYNLAVVDTAGNVIGNSNKTSNQNEELSIKIDKNTNRYYYVGIYVNTYGASSHTANLTCEYSTENTPDWYYMDVPCDDGSTVQIYIDALGEVAREGKEVTAIAKKNTEVGWKSYKFNNSNWILSPISGMPPPGSVVVAGLDDGLVSTQGIIPKIDINKLKYETLNTILTKLGISSEDFEPDDIDYFLRGIEVSVDDNVTFGLRQKFLGLEIAYDECFFVSGKIITDAAFLSYFSTVAGVSAGASVYLFAQAEVTAVVGGVAIAGGITAPVGVAVEVGSVASLAGGAGCAVISGVATKAATKSNNLLQASKAAKNSLPNYNAGNFNKNIRNSYGSPPSYMSKPQAHHMFPQKRILKEFFTEKGMDIHNPKYGSWVDRSTHLSDARRFNSDWEKWIDENGEATISEILTQGRKFAQKYGYKINF